MNAIELMLIGEMDMSVFVELLKSDTKVQDDVKALVPSNAIYDRAHGFWRCISFDTLEKNNFDFLSMLHQLRTFDGTLGDNLDIFGSIRAAYMFYYPELKCTQKYEQAYDLYLDVTKDCFDGPEVSRLVEQIIQEALLIKPKRKQVEKAKKEIHQHFHVLTSKKPRWVQGPEWPMGTCSPMRFLSQVRSGETVRYSFEDVDTKEIRLIEQYY